MQGYTSLVLLSHTNPSKKLNFLRIVFIAAYAFLYKMFTSPSLSNFVSKLLDLSCPCDVLISKVPFFFFFFYPCWPVCTVEGANNGDMHIRNWRWNGLINHIFFFFFAWHGRGMYIAYLRNTQHQVVLWGEGQSVEAVWCFGRCSSWKLWVRLSMWMLF